MPVTHEVAGSSPVVPASFLPREHRLLDVAGVVAKILFQHHHRHSTVLHALGAAAAAQKEVLRHANIQTTINICIQALLPSQAGGAIEGRGCSLANVMCTSLYLRKVVGIRK